MDKLKEAFLPVYNSVSQVKSCTSSMLGEEVVNAEISIVIGHNGRNFVSSTDWRLTTSSGRKRIFPFTIHPQYPNFVECVAGMGYVVDSRQRFAARGFFNSRSKLTVRVLTRDETEAVNRAFFSRSRLEFFREKYRIGKKPPMHSPQTVAIAAPSRPHPMTPIKR